MPTGEAGALSASIYMDKGDSKQLEHLGLLISRIFLMRLHKEGDCDQILKRFRQEIFAGHTFTFEKFVPGDQDRERLDDVEINHARAIRESLDYLVKQLGGKVASNFHGANTIVHFKDSAYSRKLFVPPTMVKVHF